MHDINNFGYMYFEARDQADRDAIDNIVAALNLLISVRETEYVDLDSRSEDTYRLERHIRDNLITLINKRESTI